MLTEKETEKRLFDLAEEFRSLVKQGEYAQAKHRYEVARNVSVFMEISAETRDRLFGIRGEKGTTITQGAFPEKEVMQTFEKMVVRAPVTAP